MADYSDGSVVIETGLDAEGFKAGSEKLLHAMDRLAQKLDNLCVSMERAFSDSASNLRAVGSAALDAGNRASEANHQTMQSAQEASSSTAAYAQAMDGARTSAQRLASGQGEIDKAIAQTQRHIEQLMERQELQRRKWEAAQDEAIAKAAERAGAERDSMMLLPWENEAQAMEEATRHMNEVVNEAIEKFGRLEDTQAFKNIQIEIDYAREKLENLIARKNELARQNTGSGADIEQVGDKAQKATVDVKKLGDGIFRVIQVLGQAAVKAAQFAARLSVSTVRAFANALKSAATNALTLARSLGKLSFNVLSKGIDRATSALKKYISTTKKGTLDSNSLIKSLTGIKRLLLTRIKRMFISSIFKDVGEGIQRLAKFDKAFNRTMSNITNTATRLKGNIAVAVGNILTTLEPVIVRLLGLLDRVFTSINQIFAVFSGKNTYTVAKQGADDYAKSVDDAAKKQKKLNAELYGFDELTRQQQKNDEDDDSKNSGIQYETRNIDLPKGVLDWVDKLKKAWQSGDWYNVGTTIADGLNAGMKVVDDWINNKFHPLAVEWADRIGTIINGLVDGFDWELLGKTIADGMNAIFDALEHFLDRVNWENLGRGIGRAIVSWFENVDLQMIGRVFAKKWMAIVRIIKGIVTTPGFWTGLGKSIADFIRGWFEGIDFDDIADTIIAVLNGIPKAIDTFLNGDPFSGVAGRIFNAINRVIHEVEWSSLAVSLAQLFLTIIDNLRQIIAGIDWPAVFDGLRNMLVTVSEMLIDYLGSIDWGSVTATLAEGFNTMIAGVNEIIGKPEFWAGLGTTVAEAVQGLFGNISYDDIATTLINLINGATIALENFLLSDGFAGVGESITNAIQRVVNEVRWADLLDLLTTLFRNVLNGILDVADTINWPEVANKVGQALASLPWARIFETLWTILKGLIEGLLSSGDGKVILAVGAGILALKTGILGAVAKLGAGLLASLLGKITGFVGKLIAPVITGLTSSLPAAISSAAPAITGALSALGSAILPAATAALCIYDAVKLAQLGYDFIEVEKELDDAITNEVNTAMNSMIRCYESGGQETVAKWMEMAYGVKSTGEGMEADMRALAERIAELQGTSADEIYQEFTRNADLMKLTAEESGNAIAQSVEASSGKVTEAAQGMTDNIGTAAQQLDEKITQPVESMSQSVSTSAESMNTNASASTRQMGQNMETAWEGVSITWQQALADMEAALNTSLTNMLALTAQGAADQTQPLFDRWGEVMEFMQLATQSIETTLTLSTQNMTMTVTTTMTAISETIKSNVDSISQITESSLTTIEASVSARLDSILTKTASTMTEIHARFDEKWKAIVSVFETSLQSMESKAVSSMENLKRTTFNAIEAIKSQPWESIGENIIKGIGKGIENNWPWLEDLVRKKANELLKATKQELGINSPSKAFEEQVGENIGYGWEKGVENTKGSILKTVSNIANAIVDEAENGPTIHTELDATMDGTLDSMQTVIAGLSAVALTFKAIAETLSGIGGFTMPQIAAGSVVPYRTKAAAESAPADDSELDTAHLTSIENLLQRLLEIVQSGENRQIIVKVTLDGRVIYETVVDENNRQIQRTGASAIRV